MWVGHHAENVALIEFSTLFLAVIIGLVGGLFGAIIVRCYRLINLSRAKFSDSIFFNPYVYAIFVALITTLGNPYILLYFYVRSSSIIINLVGSFSYFVNFPNFGGFLCKNSTDLSQNLFHGAFNLPTSLILLTFIKLILFIVATGILVHLHEDF